MKDLEKAAKALNNKREEIADKQGLYLDQINWSTGMIFDADVKITDRVAIGRIPRELLKEQREMVHAITALDEKVGELKWNFAEKLSCLPADIDPQTGEVKGDLVEGVDPYAKDSEQA